MGKDIEALGDLHGHNGEVQVGFLSSKYRICVGRAGRKQVEEIG